MAFRIARWSLGSANVLNHTTRSKRIPCATGTTALFSTNTNTGKQVVLAKRPEPNTPVTLDNFRVEQSPEPVGSETGMVVKTIYLSTDPYLRCRFNSDTGVDYTKPFQIDQPIQSAGIGLVTKGNPDLGFEAGDIVLEAFDSWPWQEFVHVTTEQAQTLRKIPMEMALLCPITFTLGSVGQTGISAYFGILGEVNPGPEDVVVVSGAAGAVGSIAVQLAKSRGSRVVGIAGSQEKCDTLTNTLGIDAAVNYKLDTFESDLAEAITETKASIYFDNVGGCVTDSVIQLMRPNGHIVLCGQIATYDSDVPYPPPLPKESERLTKENNITRQRYLVFNYEARFNEAIKQLLVLAAGESLKGIETYKYGIEETPNAFVSMMNGGNMGKQLVQVSDVPSRLDSYNKLRSFIPKQVRSWAASRISL